MLRNHRYGHKGGFRWQSGAEVDVTQAAPERENEHRNRHSQESR